MSKHQFSNTDTFHQYSLPSGHILNGSTRPTLLLLCNFNLRSIIKWYANTTNLQTDDVQLSSRYMRRCIRCASPIAKRSCNQRNCFISHNSPRARTKFNLWPTVHKRHFALGRSKPRQNISLHYHWGGLGIDEISIDIRQEAQHRQCIWVGPLPVWTNISVNILTWHKSDFDKNWRKTGTATTTEIDYREIGWKGHRRHELNFGYSHKTIFLTSFNGRHHYRIARSTETNATFASRKAVMALKLKVAQNPLRSQLIKCGKEPSNS